MPASIDLIIYIITFQAHRRQRRIWSTQQMARLKHEFWMMFGPLLSHLAVKYINTVYAPLNNMARLPTAIRHQREGHRQYTVVDPEAKWDIMEQAREAGISVSAALNLRNSSEEYGNCDSTSYYWINKKLCMYSDNAESRFGDTKTVNLLVDQGTFDGKCFSFSVHYSWELDEGN